MNQMDPLMSAGWNLRQAGVDALRAEVERWQARTAILATKCERQAEVVEAARLVAREINAANHASGCHRRCAQAQLHNALAKLDAAEASR